MAPGPEHFRALFEPRGVVVAGAATHPGKFGFSAFHNIRANGYAGALYGTNLESEPVLGEQTWPSIADLPDGDDLDLVVLCVPGRATEAVLRQAAERGVRAVFSAAAGYAEAGPEGARAQADLVALVDELDLLLVGPNGQGLVSTPARLCAQIVAPYPPAGTIAVASQSGGLVSAFGNWARAAGVGISRAVSAGNSAQTGVVDFLEYFADDPHSSVGLAYVEDVDDRLVERLAAVTPRLPVVLLRGGRTAPVARAVRVHTGSTPSDDPDLDRALADVGVSVVRSVPEAFRVAATFATQPLPRGPRTVVFGTAGGWGVLTADAVAAGALELVELPTELAAEVDARVPPRWSRGNPVDLAGGETRDTVPELLPLIAAHPDVDAVVYLGLGIQSNQADLLRHGGFADEHGLERIIDYHERQDRRFAEAADAAARAAGKPVVTSTELALTMPQNAGPATVRSTGRFCHSSGDEAVGALEHLWHYARTTRPG